MTDQIPLFTAEKTRHGIKRWHVSDAVKRSSRRSDPVTSRRAAREQVESGRADNHERLVLEAVTRRPGSTYRELWQWLQDEHGITWEAVEVMRRLGGLQRTIRGSEEELVRMPLVRKSTPRKCQVSGRSACTWELA